MPKRTYSKKRASRKSRGLRKRAWKSRVPRQRALVKTGVGFPLKMMMVHKYFETVDVSNTSGSTAVYQWRCNSLFDPNYTGSGHQPFYFDQVASIYSHYTVIGAKISVKVSHGPSGGTAANCAIFINDDTAVTPTVYACMEQTKSRYRFLTANTYDPITLRLKWSAKKAFGGSILGNPNLQGTVAASPSEEQLFTVAIFPQDLSSTQVYNLQVFIEYIAIWTEIRDIGSS